MLRRRPRQERRRRAQGVRNRAQMSLVLLVRPRPRPIMGHDRPSTLQVRDNTQSMQRDLARRMLTRGTSRHPMHPMVPPACARRARVAKRVVAATQPTSAEGSSHATTAPAEHSATACVLSDGTSGAVWSPEPSRSRTGESAREGAPQGCEPRQLVELTLTCTCLSGRLTRAQVPLGLAYGIYIGAAPAAAPLRAPDAASDLSVRLDVWDTTMKRPAGAPGMSASWRAAPRLR